MSTPQIPTGDTVIALLNPQGTQSGATHIIHRRCLQSRHTPPGSTVRPNTHLWKMLSGQRPPTAERIQPIHPHRIIVKTNTYRGRHCHSNTQLLESLSQSTHHLGYTYFIRAAHTIQMSQTPDTNRRLYCNHPYHTPACIGDTLLGDMHIPQSELSRLLNKLPIT